MSIEDKLQELGKKVLAATRQGKIIWEETAREDEFSASFAKGAISISKELQDLVDGEAAWGHKLSLYNEDGDLTEEEWDLDRFSELYKEARRSARGAERTVDSLLDELTIRLGG